VCLGWWGEPTRGFKDKEQPTWASQVSSLASRTQGRQMLGGESPALLTAVVGDKVHGFQEAAPEGAEPSEAR
jgi:hypothetical protein